jgi:hypothetical protein
MGFIHDNIIRSSSSAQPIPLALQDEHHSNFFKAKGHTALFVALLVEKPIRNLTTILYRPTLFPQQNKTLFRFRDTE